MFCKLGCAVKGHLIEEKLYEVCELRGILNGLATFETKTVAVSCQCDNIPNKIGLPKNSGKAGVKSAKLKY